jgi:predicted nucleic acid-binding protein
MIRLAIATANRLELVVWGALIVEAARGAGCHSLLSEDLHGGQAVDGLTAEKPFAS